MGHQIRQFARKVRTVSTGLYLSVCLALGSLPSSVTDFGSASVNGSGNNLTVSFSLSGVTAKPTSLIGGVDFTTGALSCNTNFTACSAVVTFLPRTPGLKQDALQLKASNGTVVASAFLHGIGTAPLLGLLPATISTLAGNGRWNYVNGAATAASFRGPQGLAVDLHGNVFIADSINQVVRKFSLATGVVSTVAGNGNPGFSGDGGAALSATLNTPTAVAIDAAGNIFIADQGNALVRRVDAVSSFITTIAGGGNILSDGVQATAAALSGPNNIAVDINGDVYIADSFHNLVRKVKAATGVISTFAGGGSAAGSDGVGDGGPATAAQLTNPTGLAFDSAGNLYIADTGHSMVRMVSSTTGEITAVAGTGAYGNSGDGSLAVNATLGSPTGIRLDAAGSIYIADSGMQQVRLVDSSNGVIATLAGNGTGAYSGDGSYSTSASLNAPQRCCSGLLRQHPDCRFCEQCHSQSHSDTADLEFSIYPCDADQLAGRCHTRQLWQCKFDAVRADSHGTVSAESIRRSRLYRRYSACARRQL